MHYERAHQLLPRDKDVTANLQFARSQHIDQVDLRRASHRALVEGIHNLANAERDVVVGMGYLLILTALALLASSSGAHVTGRPMRWLRLEPSSC